MRIFYSELMLVLAALSFSSLALAEFKNPLDVDYKKVVLDDYAQSSILVELAEHRTIVNVCRKVGKFVDCKIDKRNLMRGEQIVVYATDCMWVGAGNAISRDTVRFSRSELNRRPKNGDQVVVGHSTDGTLPEMGCTFGNFK